MTTTSPDTAAPSRAARTGLGSLSVLAAITLTIFGVNAIVLYGPDGERSTGSFTVTAPDGSFVLDPDDVHRGRWIGTVMVHVPSTEPEVRVSVLDADGDPRLRIGTVTEDAVVGRQVAPVRLPADDDPARLGPSLGAEPLEVDSPSSPVLAEGRAPLRAATGFADADRVLVVGPAPGQPLAVTMEVTAEVRSLFPVALAALGAAAALLGAGVFLVVTGLRTGGEGW